jgi:two-component system, cell cycle response regulator
MALRVLLGDESISIKKVMQLALQDFGVEVKAVPIGIDVVSVAKSWIPDIFFIDVLLAKKNGYEVSKDIKNDPTLSKVPVVLMWSGFMDLDETKAQQSKADRRLEKPFDADTLRGLVKDLIPATKENVISGFLTFPHLPDFIEKSKAANLSAASESSSSPEYISAAPTGSTSEETMLFPELDSDEAEAFTHVPLPNIQITNPEQKTQEQWASGDLERFKINLPKDDLVELDPNMPDIMSSPIVLAGQGEVQLGDIMDKKSNPTKANPTHNQEYPTPSAGISPNLIDPAMIEQVLREQVKTVLQDIAWKIIPEMTERIVREEIKKLLKDAEKLT